MHLLEFSDATSFLDRSRDFLLLSEAENNLLLSSAWTLAKGSSSRSPRLSFFVVQENGNVTGAALNSPDRRLLISHSSSLVAEFMGHEISKREVKVKGVLGPAPSVKSFCEAFDSTALSSSLESKVLQPRLLQKIMRLEKLTEHKMSSGILKTAKEKDLKLLLRWTRQFVEECGIIESPEETEEMVRKYVDNRQLFIWEDTRPVAMAGFGGVTPNGVRVNMVYTDPSFRSRGYAGSLVHLLSRKLLAAGHRFCFLFTDASNPVSNRIYEKLGYRTICEFTEYHV